VIPIAVGCEPCSLLTGNNTGILRLFARDYGLYETHGQRLNLASLKFEQGFREGAIREIHSLVRVSVRFSIPTCPNKP
jgi:hypothetical protein